MKIKSKLYLAVISLSSILMITGCNSKRSEAGKNYKLAMKAIKESNYKDAEKLLQKSVQDNPDKSEYYIDYGLVLVHENKLEEAILQFDKAMIDKDNQIVKENNKRASRGKGIAYYENKEYSKAIEEFDKALKIDELDDLNLDILLYKSDAQVKIKEYEKAIETYTTILQKRNNDASIYASRAYAYGLLQKNDKALADYDKAIQMDKENYDYYFGKYMLLAEGGKSEDAQSCLKEALTIKKTEGEDDNYNLGRLYYLQGNFDTAKAQFQTALNKGFLGANFYLAQIGEKEGNIKSAISYYEAYILNVPNLRSAVSFNQLGMLLIDTKEYETALNYIEQGIGLNDYSIMQSLKYNQISALEHLGRFEEALSKMQEYIKNYDSTEDVKREYEFLKTRVPTNKAEGDITDEENTQPTVSTSPKPTSSPAAS